MQAIQYAMQCAHCQAMKLNSYVLYLQANKFINGATKHINEANYYL